MSAPPSTTELDDHDARLGIEACRLHERYTLELIERFNLCPWARRSRLDGEVERHPLLQRSMDAAPTLALLDRLEAAPRPIPIALAIYPRLAVTPRQFDAMAAEIKALDQARHQGRPIYVSATFHPDYPLDLRSPSALVPWLRRSPDPSLQLVRLDVIEAARGRTGKMMFDFSPAAWEEVRRRVERGTVPERVAADNHATAERERDEMERVVADIAADRARSYAGLV